jgi:hypothetical protein
MLPTETLGAARPNREARCVAALRLGGRSSLADSSSILATSEVDTHTFCG